MASEDLKSVLNAVNAQVIQLAFRWKIFCQLFDSGPENIQLMNKSGSNVFGLFQRLVLDDVMICLSKLTDPEKSPGGENASIKNVLGKARTYLSAPTFTEVEALIVELEHHVQNVRSHRNKALAHADLSHALNVAALPAITYDELEKAMKTLQEIVNKVASEALRWTTHYDPIIQYGCGGDSLLKVLKRAHSDETNR